MLVGVHHQDVPTQQAVVAETDLLGADDGALCRHIEIRAEAQMATHRELRAVSDARLAAEAHRAAHLPDAA